MLAWRVKPKRIVRSVTQTHLNEEFTFFSPAPATFWLASTKNRLYFSHFLFYVLSHLCLQNSVVRFLRSADFSVPFQYDSVPLKSNQIKSLLLSHHHSTSALVSEILMSVLQTVQKNNRQFTYGQTVQKNNKQFTYGQTVQKNNKQFTYGQTVQKNCTGAFTVLQTVQKNNKQFTYGQTVQKNNKQFTYGQTVQKNCTGAFTVLQTVQKNQQQFTYGQTVQKKQQQQFTYGQTVQKTTAIYIWTVHIYRLYRRQCAKYTYIYSVRLVYYRDILNYHSCVIGCIFQFPHTLNTQKKERCFTWLSHSKEKHGEYPSLWQ